MSGHRRLPVAIILLALAAGSARAEPGGGVLSVVQDLAVDGHLSSAPRAGAFFAAVDKSGEFAGPQADIRLDVLASRAILTKVTWTEEDPVENFVLLAQTPPEVEERSFDSVRLTIERTADDGARLLVASDAIQPDSSRVALDGAIVRGVSSYIPILKVGTPGEGKQGGTVPRDAYYEYTVRGAFDAYTAKELALTALADRAEIYVRGFRLTVTGADGSEAFETGDSRTGLAPGAPNTRHQITFVIARLEGAVIDAGASDANAHWYGADPEWTVDGGIAARAAAGRIEAGRRAYDVRGEPLVVTGSFTMSLTRTSEGPEGPDKGGAFDPEFQARLDGDIRAVSVAAVPAFTDTAATAAAAGVVGLAVLVAFWPAVKWWTTIALLPLYTRLHEPEILDNEVRNQIYNIIRENPGISARAVHRAAGQSWGTVVYHLRQLERHHLVTSKRVGRSRNFYENHGKYRGMEVALATLNAPRALQIARAVLGEPGLTQERLTEATALPQPTVSYYVRKLKDAQLIIEAREGRYARYSPIADLARLVQIADAEGVPLAAASPPPVAS